MDIQLNQQKEVKEKIKSVSNDIANQMSRVGDTNVSFDKRKVEIVKSKVKENVHTLLPSADPSIPQSEIDKFNHYSSWAAENCPKLLKIKKPLTAIQLSEIRKKYSVEQFKEVCFAMEAKKDFLSKYDNLNLTMQSWLKRQFGAGGNSQPPPKVPLQKGIEMPELVTPVVDFLANGQ